MWRTQLGALQRLSSIALPRVSISNRSAYSSDESVFNTPGKAFYHGVRVTKRTSILRANLVGIIAPDEVILVWAKPILGSSGCKEYPSGDTSDLTFRLRVDGLGSVGSVRSLAINSNGDFMSIASHHIGGSETHAAQKGDAQEQPRYMRIHILGSSAAAIVGLTALTTNASR